MSFNEISTMKTSSIGSDSATMTALLNDDACMTAFIFTLIVSRSSLRLLDSVYWPAALSKSSAVKVSSPLNATDSIERVDFVSISCPSYISVSGDNVAGSIPRYPPESRKFPAMKSLRPSWLKKSSIDSTIRLIVPPMNSSKL